MGVELEQGGNGLQIIAVSQGVDDDDFGGHGGVALQQFEQLGHGPATEASEQIDHGQGRCPIFGDQVMDQFHDRAHGPEPDQERAASTRTSIAGSSSAR
jgi:hypothetical protein